MAIDNELQNQKQKLLLPKWLFNSLEIRLCTILLLLLLAGLIPAVVSTNSVDGNKSGVVADSAAANFTYDQKDRDRLTSASPFGSDNATNKTQPSDKSSLMGPDDTAVAAGGAAVEGSNQTIVVATPPPASTTTTSTTTTTTTEAPEPLIPPATVNANIAQMHSGPKKKGQIIISSEPDCPSLEGANTFSQTQLLKTLTHNCRYDRLERPITYDEKNQRIPVDVHARAYIYFIQNLEAHDLQFKIHALIQFRFVDPRLVFREVAPSRTAPIMGEASLRDSIWVPHVFLSNERSSSIMGTMEKDILTSISPDGTVIVSSRVQAQLYCWMNLRKFPFDEQTCKTTLESWMYNSSELVLHWEQRSPITVAPELHLTEYVLTRLWTNETLINADLKDLRHGAFAGNYSSLSFNLHLAREMGFYMMDYFIPSIMIVAISWVSFWLQADQAPPRIMLGTSTMLTFITLASAQGKTLPKVSYIKASEIWFLACTAFIFGSLVEFAFVNTIWRRKRNIELKKVNSKYILKSTLTPRPSRKEIGGGGLQKSHSCTSLDGQSTTTTVVPSNTSYNNYLTVHGFPSKNVPAIVTEVCDDVHDNGNVINMEPNNNRMSSSNSNLSNIDAASVDQTHLGWTTMTPQQIAIWIDKRARFVFPVGFLVFNIFYWIFVLVV